MVRAEWEEVVRVAQRCGVANGECPDVALEVFFRYALFRASISSPRAIPSWLRSTAVHVAYRFRTTTIARHETPRAPGELENVGGVPSAEEELSALEGERELRRLVDGLEADRREVFRRHVLQGQSIHDLAAELGIPEATAYNRLRLAREDLQAALRREERIEERRTGRRRLGLFSFLLFLRRETAERWSRLWRDLRARLSRTPLRGLSRFTGRQPSRVASAGLLRVVLQGILVLGIGAGVATGGGEGSTSRAGVRSAVSSLDVAVQAVTASRTPPRAEVESPVETGMLPRATSPEIEPSSPETAPEGATPGAAVAERGRLARGEGAGSSEVPSRGPRQVVARPLSGAAPESRTAALTADRLATAAARAGLSRGSTRDAWTDLRDGAPVSR